MTIFNDGDKSDFVTFYQKYYKYNIKSTDELFDENEYNKYKYIVVGTGDDIIKLEKIYSNIKDKIVTIYHILGNINHFHNKNIVLTPLNITPKSQNYVLPIYDTYENIDNNKQKNIYALIGRFKDGNRDTNELINIIKNNRETDFEINIYVRHKKFIPSCIFELSKEYPKKLKIFIGIKTLELEKNLKNTRFMISFISQDSVYHTDRLSGIIPFAYNFNIPLIIDKVTNNIYNFKSTLVYEHKVSEIFSDINNLNQEQYSIIVRKMIEEKKEIIKKNNIVLDSIFTN